MEKKTKSNFEKRRVYVPVVQEIWKKSGKKEEVFFKNLWYDDKKRSQGTTFPWLFLLKLRRLSCLCLWTRAFVLPGGEDVSEKPSLCEWGPAEKIPRQT